MNIRETFLDNRKMAVSNSCGSHSKLSGISKLTWILLRSSNPDTHTALTHPLAPGRIYSAAGDGYFESTDAADSWSSPEDGLKHRYLVGVAVDPADADTVIVSATDGPGSPIRREGPRRTCIGRLGFRDGNSQ